MNEVELELKRIQLLRARMDLEDAIARRQRKVSAAGMVRGIAMTARHALAYVSRGIVKWWFKTIVAAAALGTLVLAISFGKAEYTRRGELKIAAEAHATRLAQCATLERFTKDCHARHMDGNEIVECSISKLAAEREVRWCQEQGALPAQAKPSDIATSVSVDFFFAVGDATLAPGAAEQLADAIKAATRGSRLRVVGYYSSADDRRAELLAKRRAELVRDVLLGLGVPASKLLVMIPEGIAGNGDDPDSRRVRVWATQD